MVDIQTADSRSSRDAENKLYNHDLPTTLVVLVKRLTTWTEASMSFINRRLTSPILSLPPELLKIIFTFALPSRASDVHSYKQSPTNVSVVCTLWRDIAISTPFLWSHLSFNGGQGSKLTQAQDTEAIVSCWTLWLKRTSSCPLRFTLHCDEVYPGPDGARIDPHATQAYVLLEIMT